ncbi:MAG: sensor histidine kinase [Acidithiobacillales bacterium]
MSGASRGLLSSGLLLVAVLFAVATGMAAPTDVPRLAAVAGGAVVVRALLLAPAVGRAFGDFALPVDLGSSLLLVLLALALTGGLASDLYPLLLVEIVLARLGEGPSAGRFLAVAATGGAAALAIPGLTAGALPTVGTALRLAWPAAFLLLIEVVPEGARPKAPSAPPQSRPGSGEIRSASSASRPPAALVPPAATEAGPAPPPTAPTRDTRQELLHDLKSPLSVVRVYADLIAEGVRRGEAPRPEHLANLDSEIGLMESLVGVRRPARQAAPSPPPSPPRTELVKLLTSLAESYHAAHGEKIYIDFLADQETIFVAADAVAVQRALRNVLDNAVKYTPPGGKIRMRASIVAQHVFIVISDTGIGMTREEQKRAFEYAYRGEAARATGAEGRGLGLALVRELLEAQGGKISLLSEPGHGLEVTIMFPLLSAGAA